MVALGEAMEGVDKMILIGSPKQLFLELKMV
jgi:hypothetical protein